MANNGLVLLMVSSPCAAAETHSTELAPLEDRGTFFVNMSGAEGASYANNSRNMRLIEDMLMPYYEKGELNRLLIRVPGLAVLRRCGYSWHRKLA